MFRRKEDSLFDNATDPNQPAAMGTGAATPPPAASSSTPSAPAHSTPPSRNASEMRTPPPPPASSFRPSAAPIGGEMTRNRMPEAKSSMVSSPASSMEKSSRFGKRVLTVGNDILLKGEIATCDRLVIEGKVDATLNDVHTVEIAESGSFKGSAQIEDAEISGLFEGDLTVRNRLIIYSTGRVRGKITYGEVEIQRGGELSGEIKASATQTGAGRGNSRQPAKEKDDSKVAA